MAYLTNTPGSFNHWNYTDENDFYKPYLHSGNGSPAWAEKLSDEKQWGSLGEDSFIKYAKENGYTGPKKNAVKYLLGMATAQGGEVPYGQYNSGGAITNMEVLNPLLQFVSKADPQLFQTFKSGMSYTPDFTGGDLIARLWTAGAGGMAAAGAGAAGAAGAEGAAAAEGAAGAADGLYGLNTGITNGVGMANAGGGAVGSGVGTSLAGGASGVGMTGGGALGAFAPTAGGATFGIPNNILEGLIKGGLGYLGSGKQADAYQNVANQNLALGAPYRNALAASYGPNFDLTKQPGYGDAFNRMADIATRQWSTRGNPANTPGIAGGILNDVWNQSYLPALANYRGQLGQFGGLGLNTSGAAQLGAANSAGGQWEAIGAGLQTAMGKNPYEDIFKKMNPFPGSQNLGLMVNGVRYG